MYSYQRRKTTKRISTNTLLAQNLWILSQLALFMKVLKVASSTIQLFDNLLPIDGDILSRESFNKVVLETSVAGCDVEVFECKV